MKIVIFDFEDSFTYNIFSELSEIFNQETIQVIQKESILSHLQTLANHKEPTVVVLGPGPGHPDQYIYLHKAVERLLVKENIFIFGICLGHQILCQMFGARVDLCKKPIHGQSISYKLDNDLAKSIGVSKNIVVQRYNSLAVFINNEFLEVLKSKKVEFYEQDHEVLILKSNSLLSYQFHPESIGTTCPKSFFKPISEFLL